MREAYILLAFFLITFNVSAQRTAIKGNPFESDGRLPKIISNNEKALTDTVFYFNGWYFKGTGIDTGGTTPFLYHLQDLDTLKLSYRYTSFHYPSKISFLFNHEVLAPNDTSFWIETISDFIPPGIANDWISFGPITIPAGDSVTLSWKHNYPDYQYRDGYKIFVDSVGSNSISSPIYTVNDNDSSTIGDTTSLPHYIFYPRSTDLSAHAGQSVYLAINHPANNMDRLLITDILIKASPITNTVTTTGINLNTTAASVTIYPNPSAGLFTINVGTTLKTHIEVYNSMAEMVYTKDFASLTTSIDLSNLNAGVYSVKIISFDNKITIKEVIITR